MALMVGVRQRCHDFLSRQPNGQRRFMSKRDKNNTPTKTPSSSGKSAMLQGTPLGEKPTEITSQPEKAPYDKFRRQRRVEDWFPN